jgi:16S rRNA (uracil1498-N3)-methyltransferase
VDRHHLERVRRLRDGDGLTVGDGRGSFRVVRFGAALRPGGPIERTTAPQPAVAVGFALTKGDRPELVVQKLTELGVDRVLPFVAARTVVRWDAEKAARNVERWRAIAREAAAQAHRPWLPAVEPVRPFPTVASEDGASLAEPGGRPPTLAHPVVLVGPEGGWAPEELAALRHRTALPGHVLRAETAAVVAGALLVALRGEARAGVAGSAEI